MIRFISFILTFSLSFGRVIAIGDVHGRLTRLKEVLYQQEVIDKDGSWIAEDTTVVQVGDLLDRGPEDRDLLDYVMRLQKEGNWVQLLGNHELMNLEFDFRYANDSPTTGFGTVNERSKYMRRGIYSNWLRNLPVIYQQDGVVYLHAGITPQLAKKGIDFLNHNSKGYLKKIHDDSHIIKSLVWDRHLALEDEQIICPQVEEILNIFNATQIVLGHTTFDKITSRCSNKVKLIDTRLVEIL